MGKISWSEMIGQYTDDATALAEARNRAAVDSVDKELLGSMSSSTAAVLQELRKKMRFDRETLSENELCLLSGRQKEVATLRQKYSYREIAELLTLTIPTIYNIYSTAVRKIWRIRKTQQQNLLVGLSLQQQQIYTMRYKEARTELEISKNLSISLGTVKKQIHRIKNKVER